MTTGEVVAKRIDELLIQRDMSLYRLAHSACIPVSTLQNLYRGHTKSPTLALVYKIADAFGMTIGEFVASPLFSADNIEFD